MAIITISRELAALGDETARELAKLSGYRFVDRKLLEQKIIDCGVSGDVLKKFDERKPEFFSSLSGYRDDYLHYLKTAMLEEAGDGNCIFVGRGAFAVFQGVPAVLPVFLTATPAVRLERLRGYFRCDEKKALDIITRSDNDRQGFHAYFFDVKWRDSSNYKMTLNTAQLTPAACAAIIEYALKFVAAPDAEVAGTERLGELRLAQKVAHHILYEKTIGVHFLDVRIRCGTATLYGVANTVTLIDTALDAAREVQGVEKAVSEIQVIQDYALFH